MTQPGEDLEVPNADAYEQSVPADPAAAAPRTASLPDDVNEADAVEQSQVVAGLDDEYR